MERPLYYHSPWHGKHPIFDEAKPDKLDPQDVADAVLFAIEANQRNNVREIYLMPTN